MNTKRLISSIIFLFMIISCFTGCDKVKSAGQAIGNKASEAGEAIGSKAGEIKDNFDNSPAGRSIKNPFTKSNIVFQAQTRFLYSLDGGTSWSETIQEVPVGSTYYLAIEMQISQSEQTNEEQVIVSTVRIPSTNVVDCYLDDHPGVSITGNKDSVTGVVSYNFKVVAGVKPDKFRVVFECIPMEKGRAQVEVVYDDKVSENWDKTGTIKYVETKSTAQNADN